MVLVGRSQPPSTKKKEYNHAVADANTWNPSRPVAEPDKDAEITSVEGGVEVVPTGKRKLPAVILQAAPSPGSSWVPADAPTVTGKWRSR